MRLLIWDFDGTLGYRAGGMWTAALLEIVERQAPESQVTVEQIRPFLQSGFPWHTPDRPHPEIRSADEWWDALNPLFERALRGIGFSSSRARVMARQVRHVYPDPTHWQLFDDVLPALKGLASLGWAHVALSNHVPELCEIIRHLGLMPYLLRVFNSAETGYEKPHPRAFQLALEAFPDATTVWMIGDSVGVDVAGAEAAGIPGILVRRCHETAARYCDNLTQVASFVQAHQLMSQY